MDKNTLSNYGWVVICTLVIAVMIALATPFGEYVAAGVQNTAQGFYDVNTKAMDVETLDSAIAEMYPAASSITDTMAEYVDNPNLNYLYAVKPCAETVEEAFIQKPGVEYIGEKKGFFWATGDTVTVMKDGFLLGEYIVVVLGDTSKWDAGVGDGVIDGLDAMNAELSITGWNDPTGAFMMATDVNGDGEISREGDFQMIMDIAMSREDAYEKAFIAATHIENINVLYDLGTAGPNDGNNKLHNADGSDFVTTVKLDGTFSLPSGSSIKLGEGKTFSHWVNQKTGKTYSGSISAYDLLLENGLDNTIIMEAQWK